MNSPAAVRERPLVRAIPTWGWVAGLVLVSVGVRFALARRAAAPWIMVDELIYSELARSFAATGQFLVRGEHLGGYGVVYPVLIAPAWRLFASVPDAYEAARAINAVLFSLAAVPAYALARRVLSHPRALLAAALAVALPSGLYAGTLMTENAFYPLSLCFALALVLALERPTIRRTVVLLAVFGLAFLTRAQAAAFLPAALAAPLLVGGLRRYRAYYAVLLGPCVAAVLFEAVRGRSPSALLGAYAAATESDYAIRDVLKWVAYHLIELDVYVAVVPVVALAILVARRGTLDARARAFVAAAVSITLLLAVEVGVFAAGNIQRIEERNMFYVAPLLLIALLVWIDRGLHRGPVALAAGAVAALVPLALPYGSLIGVQSAADTLQADFWWWLADQGFSTGEIRWTIVAGGLVAAALALVVPRRLALVLPAAVLGYFVLTTAAIENGRHGLHNASLGALYQGISKPDRDWVDAAVGRNADVAVIHADRKNRDAFQVWENEFFNRSVGPVYDAGVGPLPGGLPETRLRVDPESGLLLDGGRPVRHRYALATYGYPLIGTPVARDEMRAVTLYRTTGPLRIAYVTRGINPEDQWSGPTVRYRGFGCTGGSLLVRVQQDKSLFPGAQTIRAAGQTFRIDSPDPVYFSVNVHPAGDVCDVTFRISPTRVPGTQDPRELGIHFLQITYTS